MDSYEQPAWAVRMLERIQEEGHAEIAFVVLNDGGDAPVAAGGISRRLKSYWKNRRNFLYLVYQRLDRRRDVPGPDAFEPTDTSELLGSVPSLSVSPRQTKFSDYFSDDEVEAVEAQNLDVLVRLGFRILRGGILDAAAVGVWSFHHGDNRINRGGPAGFWEVLLEWPVSGTILQILEEDLDNGIVLDRSWSATHSVSVRANKRTFYWKSLSMVPRKLEQLRRLGREEFLATHKASQDPVNFYSQRLFLTPTNQELWRPFLRLQKRLLRNRLAVGKSQWQMRFGLSDGFGASMWRLKSLTPPPDRFWADPHVIRRDGRYYVFFEELEFQNSRGYISVLTIDDDGTVSEPTPVLKKPYHLSYPFLFEYGDELYMIPETDEQKTIELYKCDSFPHDWSLERVIRENVAAVDTTILEHDGRWWMFTNLCENPGASYDEELFVYHTDDPVRGEWLPHLQNPVVTDVRRSRPAGAFIRANGKLIRPTQDCSKHYGWALRLQEVETLTPDEYRESEIGFVEPAFEPEALGVHSIAHVDRLTVFDVNVRRRRSKG
jgi:hypothetical protein